MGQEMLRRVGNGYAREEAPDPFSAFIPWELRLAIVGGFTGAVYGYLIGWLYWFGFENHSLALFDWFSLTHYLEIRNFFLVAGECTGAIACTLGGLLFRMTSKTGESKGNAIVAIVFGAGFGVICLMLLDAYFFRDQMARRLNLSPVAFILLAMFCGGAVGGMCGGLFKLLRARSHLLADVIAGAAIVVVLFLFIGLFVLVR